MRENVMQQINCSNQRLEDQFEAICTNILFYGTDIKTIMITSLKGKEGKSTVSLALAKSFARSGKRTVMLNADVIADKVKFKTKAKESRLVGLTEFLSNQKRMEEILYSTKIENLYVIPVGMISFNATILFEGNTFKQLLYNLKNQFDYVIIDTPSIEASMDSIMIAKQTDASLLVMEARKNKRNTVKNYIHQLSEESLFLGVIFNKFDKKQNR